MPHVTEDLRQTQERLGRNAAPVEADAAQIVALDHRSLESELSRTDGGDVAPRPGADDDDVEARLSHFRSLRSHPRPNRIGHHTSISIGFSIRALNAPSNCAPSAPSTAR